MPLKAILIEDEPFVRDDLRFMLSEFPDIEIAGEAGTIREAEKLLKELEPDYIFLDIHLRGGNGMDLLPLIHKKAGIIVLTAQEDKIERYPEEIILEYILKPVTHDRLASAIYRITSKKGNH